MEKARYAQEGHSGIIRLAVNVYFVNSFVYELLNDYQTGHPDILVRVSGSNTERMIYDLNTGTIDCAICTGRPADRDIERIVLRKYRDCAVFFSPSAGTKGRGRVRGTEAGAFRRHRPLSGPSRL